MRNFLKKYIYYFLFVLLFILLFLLYEFYQNHLISIDNNNLIEKYFELKVLIDKNLILSSLIYLFFSALWISLIGVVTPMLIISTLMFGYFGSLLSIISFTVGSTLSFLVARRLKKLMKNFFKNIKIEKNSFFQFGFTDSAQTSVFCTAQVLLKKDNFLLMFSLFKTEIFD